MLANIPITPIPPNPVVATPTDYSVVELVLTMNTEIENLKTRVTALENS